MATISPSLQEAAASFVNEILGSLNNAVTDVAGVDVMWFRAKPDKRSQDVIFQSYTLYGVEDCPLTFKALYQDTGYDDAAITYNIMGINFAIPMTLDIAVDTWNAATGGDGTIPQQHDIVFIPLTRKLLEVASMQPVKQLGGQLTSYKVNLSIYTPTKSRLVGENLKESIKNNTTNLEERFGEDIKTDIDNIVDDDQLSLYTSTSQDRQKTVTPEADEFGVLDVKNIFSYDLIVDGHTVARNYYNMGIGSAGTVVTYKRSCVFNKTVPMSYSCWFRKHDDTKTTAIKNIKGMTLTIEGNEYFINTQLTAKFKPGDNIVIKRGVICIPGTVVEKNKIKVNPDQIKKLDISMPNWYNYPGFAATPDDVLHLLSGDNFEISIKGGTYVSVMHDGNETLVPISSEITPMKWYGLVINMGTMISADLYTVNGKLERVSSTDGVKNNAYIKTDEISLYLKNSNMDLTNIRLYKAENTDIDNQIRDLISYNSKSDAYAVINDSADTYLNKPYLGKQR